MNYYLEKIKIFSFEKKISLPKIEKIVIHSGIAKVNNDKNFVKNIYNSIFYITDQKPIFSKLKKSISNFKSRKNELAGVYVSLRKKKMWEFYHKLICVIIPNIKEFKGFNQKSIDRFGNFNFGISDCRIFPDFFNEYKFGFNINIVVNNLSKYYSEFYQKINFPIK